MHIITMFPVGIENASSVEQIVAKIRHRKQTYYQSENSFQTDTTQFISLTMRISTVTLYKDIDI